MKNGALHFRCYAVEEGDGDWFAICLELNLYSRASTFHEVRSQLHHAIHQYLTEAFGRDHAHLKQLLNRRAPLYFWVQRLLLVIVKAARPSRNTAVLFSERCPLAV